jgi:hypothetical protein
MMLKHEVSLGGVDIPEASLLEPLRDLHIQPIIDLQPYRAEIFLALHDSWERMQHPLPAIGLVIRQHS